MALAPESTPAELFMKYDYAETKDLAKHFLTLISAILVFSLTFSEKIVNFGAAKSVSRWSLVACWVCLFISIALCGLAICFITLAAGQAIYGGNYLENANTAWDFMLIAGSIFVVGLMALMMAGILSVFQLTNKSQENSGVTQAEVLPTEASIIGDRAEPHAPRGEFENRA